MARRNSNSGTGIVKGDMATFDRLPKHIRQKLANANHNWSPEESLDTLLWEGAAYLSAQISTAEAALAERHYAILASGKTYPKETAK